MDTKQFEDWLVVDCGMAEITSRVMGKRLKFSVKNGLDLNVFQADPDRASRAYLAARSRAATSHAYNNDVKLLTNLALFYGKKISFAYRKGNPRLPKALPPHQLVALRDYHHPNARVRLFRRAVCAVLLVSGLRPSECARLEVEDLDMVRSTIRIRQPAKRGLIREIPVPRSLWRPRSPLMAYLRARPVPAKLPRRLWVKDWNSGGKRTPLAWPVTTDAMRREITRVSKELGFRLSHTALRHTVATRIYKEFGDIMFVKFVLGHKAISSTMVYAEPTEQDHIDRFHRRRKRSAGG